MLVNGNHLTHFSATPVQKCYDTECNQQLLGTVQMFQPAYNWDNQNSDDQGSMEVDFELIGSPNAEQKMIGFAFEHDGKTETFVARCDP